ncbi:MAG TPA: hypothetical protein VEL76_08600 [Gemmataceae bacterium]|nr:hypothetical protein [Gemmataceae bacterium]
MQVYAITQGLAACMSSIALLGGCNRCSCRHEVEMVWTGSVVRTASWAPVGVEGSAASNIAPPDLGGGTLDPKVAPRRIFPYAHPERADEPGVIPQPAPPRAGLSFRPEEGERPTHLPPVAPPTQAPAAQAAPAFGPPAPRLPTPAGLAPPAPVTPPAPKAPAKTSRFGHAPDYSWLRSQVEYSHTRKEWRLRYTPLDESDPHGGRVVLIENGHVGYLVDGQFVRVEGHLVMPQEGQGTVPYYRIESFKAQE